MVFVSSVVHLSNLTGNCTKFTWLRLGVMSIFCWTKLIIYAQHSITEQSDIVQWQKQKAMIGFGQIENRR